MYLAVGVGEYNDNCGGERGDGDVSKGGCRRNVEGGCITLLPQ